MYKRLIQLDKTPDRSFFLWGPRQSGKSTLLHKMYPDAKWIDLLKSDVFAAYIKNPELLRETTEGILKPGDLVVIDEVQKIGSLLDEVHWLIENKGLCFALSGSSARKLKKGAGNLLGGRAIRKELHGLIYKEIGEEFNLTRMLNHGYLPNHYLSENPTPQLAAYAGDYLKEEIAAEGLVRNLGSFADFLNLAAISDTEMINFSTFARDVGISSIAIKNHYQILVDTLIGYWIPLYKKRPKRRLQGSNKFYFFDVGVVNFLAKRRSIEPGSELFGKAFENWIAHELLTYIQYKDRFMDISYWRLSSGVEVDFIIDQMEVAIEVKSSSRINQNYTKGLVELEKDQPDVKKRIIICLEKEYRCLENGIEIMPWKYFLDLLWLDKIF